MRILFPSLPTAPSMLDPEYDSEAAAARASGFAHSLFELEALRAGDVRTALKYCQPAREPGELLVYRGWMLRGSEYAALYRGLAERGYQLINTPEAYDQAHYLPLAYPLLDGATPATGWVEGRDVNAAWTLYQRFADAPAIIKDYVKSAKHRWREACYLPAHTTRADFERVFHAFLAERGNLFERGIVVRRYHDLVQLGEGMRGQPIHEEYRLFLLDGRIIVYVPFAQDADVAQHREDWQARAARFTSRFLVLDVARQTDDTWIIVESGDAGVSGLPLSIDPQAFYDALWTALVRQ